MNTAALLLASGLLGWWASVEWRILRGRQAPARETVGE